MSEFSEFYHFQQAGRCYVLNEPLRWLGKERFIIPKGFEFEITIPTWCKLCRKLVDAHDAALLPAAAVHDYMLEHGYSAPRAALAFRRAMKLRAIPIIKREIVFISAITWTTTRRFIFKANRKRG